VERRESGTTSASSHELIGGLPLLARLAREDVRALASHARRQSVTAGATIFCEGDAADALYVVVAGELRVAMASPAGDEVTVARIGPGEACGELGLLDGRPRSATVAAGPPTELLVVRRDDFIDWLTSRPHAALALLATLSGRIRRVNETIADFAFLDLRRRLAKRLLELAAVAGGRTVMVTQAELGSMLGVSRESVNKELNALARERAITLGRGAILIEDATALAAIRDG